MVFTQGFLKILGHVFCLDMSLMYKSFSLVVNFYGQLTAYLQGPPYISGHYISSHADYKQPNLTTKFDMLGVEGVVNLQEKICGSIPKIVDFF